jgi:aspartate carbamoyltransferase catalytic subunit
MKPSNNYPQNNVIPGVIFRIFNHCLASLDGNWWHHFSLLVGARCASQAALVRRLSCFSFNHPLFMNEPLGPNKSAEFLEPPETSASLRPDPRGILENGAPSEPALRALFRKSILSVRDFNREQIISLCRLAAYLESVEITAYHPLDGKLIITAFFEASTRTRISFESATLRLDGKIISIPEGGQTGVKKGEGLADIGEMFNAYGDLVIMRHTETDALERIQRGLRLPIINAGNGTGEHPTQALADWYALMKWCPGLALDSPIAKPLNIGILGTPGSMRTVKSFLLMALAFKQHINSVTIVSEMADPLGKPVDEIVREEGIDVKITNDMGKHLGGLDVIYMNSIVCIGDQYTAMDASYKLDAASPLKKGAVILHPLARLEELDKSLDATRHNLYFAQAHGAVFVRQALLLSVLGRLYQLPGDIQLSRK